MALRGWRSIRIHAVGTLLSIQNKAPARPRFSMLALTTTVGLVWLANGIHCRPRDNAAGRDVMLACLPLTRNRNDPHLLFVPSTRAGHDDLPIPFCPYNTVFLRQLIWPPDTDVVRITWGASMNDTSFIQYFGLTFTDYFRKKVNSGFLHRDEITRRNIPTQKRHSKSHMVKNPTIIPSLLTLPSFNLPVPGREERGPDIPRNVDEQFAAEDDAHELTAAESNALRLTRLLNNFATDVLQKCGNSKGDRVASHCHMTQQERRYATPDIFNDLTLSHFFTRVQWCHADAASWETAHDILFPERGHILISSAQSFYLCDYYSQWKDILAEMTNPTEVHIVRQAVRQQINTYSWLPDPERGRIWRYTPHDRYTSLGVPHAAGMAPRILIRRSIDTPLWDFSPRSDDIVHAEIPQPPLSMQSIIHPGLIPPDLALYDRREEEEESSDEEMEQWHTRAPSPQPIPPRAIPIPSTQNLPVVVSQFPRHTSTLRREEEEEEGDDDEQDQLDPQGAEDEEPTPRDPYIPHQLSARARLDAMAASPAPAILEGEDQTVWRDHLSFTPRHNSAGLSPPRLFNTPRLERWQWSTPEADAGGSSALARAPYAFSHLNDADHDHTPDFDPDWDMTYPNDDARSSTDARQPHNKFHLSPDDARERSMQQQIDDDYADLQARASIHLTLWNDDDDAIDEDEDERPLDRSRWNESMRTPEYFQKIL